MMTSITVSDTNSPRTVVSTFTTEPDRQAELLALLSDQADTLLRKQAGFGGCAIYASEDGAMVMSFAVWRDEEAIQGMLADPAVREHAAAVRSIATVKPIQYAIRHVVQAPPQLP
jgi:quinol monooxygenase YgiN